jgi:hypothetical protein
MSEARRKVLNLLEFCLESDPYLWSVDELIRGVSHVAGGMSDEELAKALQDYADGRIKANIMMYLLAHPKVEQ